MINAAVSRFWYVTVHVQCCSIVMQEWQTVRSHDGKPTTHIVHPHSVE